MTSDTAKLNGIIAYCTCMQNLEINDQAKLIVDNVMKIANEEES